MGESEAGMTTGRERVLSGMRPTGRLHLGNYLGALDNWVRMQDDYDCFFFVANWHALTTGAENLAEVPGATIEMIADWLGAGLDPARCTMFLQSWVPEHAELHLLFSMITPVGWLERVPTFKEMVEQLGLESPSYGLLGYPLLQAADILMYKAAWVPVGIDQVPHVELTREVARRFNNAFGPVFPEPQAKLTEIPKVPGTDGRKMSKSYGNAIYLADSADTVAQKIRPMVTDPARKRRSDPGNPDVCPVFDLHRIFTPEADREWAATGCRTAGIGCLDCKRKLLEHMEPALAGIRERRQAFAEKPDLIVDVLKQGSARAREVAQRAMDEVRRVVTLTP
jgi:tryptophanyl-tRNA synthetase